MCAMCESPRRIFGRVEMYHQGSWHPICDDFWDGTVACRQIFGEGFVASATGTGNGASDNFILDDLMCTGAESRLVDCPHLPLFNENCSRTETALVTCVAQQ